MPRPSLRCGNPTPNLCRDTHRMSTAELIEMPSGPSRVLLVDDEEAVLTVLGEILRLHGYEVTTVSDASQAVEILQKDFFAVILSDQRMPKMTGLEFLARAKELQPNASRILLTGVLDLGTIIEAINQGEIYRFI